MNRDDRKAAKINIADREFRNSFEIWQGLSDIEDWKKDNFWRSVADFRNYYMKKSMPSAIINALPFDKQALLYKFWPYMLQDSKIYYLAHAWMNKGPSDLFGYDWWIPYFSEVGFLTNIDRDFPEEQQEIVLYRGAKPEWKAGMSWTEDKTFAELFASQSQEYKIYRISVRFKEVLGVFEGTAGTLDDADEGTLSVGIEYVLNPQKLGSRILELK